MIYCYTHLLKTGGGTIRYQLPRFFSSREYLSYNIGRGLDSEGDVISLSSTTMTVTRFISDARTNQNTLKIVSTDSPVGLHLYLDKQVRYLSIVREPVERCESLYRFMLMNRDRFDFFFNCTQDECSFENSILDQKNLFFHNDQTRVISGSKDKKINEDHYEKAIKNIRKYFCRIYPYYKYPEFTKYLNRRLGISINSNIRKNIGDKTITITKEQKAIFSDANRFDSKLYEYVSNII